MGVDGVCKRQICCGEKKRIALMEALGLVSYVSGYSRAAVAKVGRSGIRVLQGAKRSTPDTRKYENMMPKWAKHWYAALLLSQDLNSKCWVRISERVFGVQEPYSAC